MEDEVAFKIRKLVAQTAVDYGLAVDPDRLRIVDTERMIRSTFAIATLDEDVFDYPENFLTRWANRWQQFKIKHFPRWLKRKYPPLNNRVYAIHKFPELNLPQDMELREFIHFRVIPEKELEPKEMF